MFREIRYYKVIKNFLESQTFFVDGFGYDFKNIEQKDGAVFLEVAVTLPKPGQSWVASKFSWDINGILQNLQGYIGEGFSVSIMTTLDGVDVEDLGYCFVSPEKEREIVTVLNKNFGLFETTAFSSRQEMEMNMSYRKTPNFYYLDGDYLQFDLDTRVKRIKLGQELVKPDINKIDLIAGTIYEKLMDSDFRSEVEGEIFSVLESEIKIREVDDCYIAVYLHINGIDGFPTVQREEYYDFVREWFT